MVLVSYFSVFLFFAIFLLFFSIVFFIFFSFFFSFLDIFLGFWIVYHFCIFFHHIFGRCCRFFFFGVLLYTLSHLWSILVIMNFLKIISLKYLLIIGRFEIEKVTFSRKVVFSS
jgi:hypothetical protein